MAPGITWTGIKCFDKTDICCAVTNHVTKWKCHETLWQKKEKCLLIYYFKNIRQCFLFSNVQSWTTLSFKIGKCLHCLCCLIKSFGTAFRTQHNPTQTMLTIAERIVVLPTRALRFEDLHQHDVELNPLQTHPGEGRQKEIVKEHRYDAAHELENTEKWKWLRTYN